MKTIYIIYSSYPLINLYYSHFSPPPIFSHMFLNLCKVDSKEREGYHIPVRERRRQIILEIAEKEGVKVSQIILFGSRTRGQARSDSDWDVLVTTEEELSFKEKWEVIDKMKACLPENTQRYNF